MTPHPDFDGSGEVTCPLCGLAFSRGDALCHHGCPIAELCHLVACPGCGYEFPQRPRAPQLSSPPAERAPRRGLLDRLVQLGRRRREPLSPQSPTVRDLDCGARARVLHLAGDRARDTLAVFGLVPGADFELLQKTPAYVLRVGETELALDGEVAGRILVAVA
jgi:DtxR family Mn-dependent transcriptional regulator/ferrous iron transport protein A